MKFESVDKILDFAISQEEKAVELYTDLASRLAPKHMKDIFMAFAEEERGHKAKLLLVKDGEQMLFAEQQVLNLKIGEYLEDVTVTGDLDYQQALVVAMKAEKNAYRMYEGLASTTDDPALKSTLLALAQEEAKHKLRFEIEYDDNILKEN